MTEAHDTAKLLLVEADAAIRRLEREVKRLRSENDRLQREHNTLQQRFDNAATERANLRREVDDQAAVIAGFEAERKGNWLLVTWPEPKFDIPLLTGQHDLPPLANEEREA